MDIFRRIFEAISETTPSPPVPVDPLSYQAETGMMLYSALGSVVVASLINILIQAHFSRKEFNRQRDQQKEHTSQLERSAALKLNIKLKLAADRLFTLMGSISSSIEDTVSVPEMALWQRIVPLAGIRETAVEFDADEIAFVLKAGSQKLANDLLLLNEVLHTTLASIRELNRRRIEMEEVFPASPNARIGSVQIDPTQAAFLVPKFIALRDLSIQGCEGIAKDFSLVLECISLIDPTFRNYFADESYRGGNFNKDSRVRLLEYEALIKKYRDIGGIGLRRE